ncbi:MAG TPA: hypothetical protein VKA84_00895 [Gemmatimonadaceae bacterium]|nr:hypothetical protein [Gemmatimonadaceae bacterium]
MTRQAARPRRATPAIAASAALAALVVLAACGGDRVAAPLDEAAPTFDAARVRSDVSALQGALAAPVLESFVMLSGQFGLGAAPSAATAGARELLSTAADPSAADARRVAAGLSASVLSAAGTAVLPPSALGRTLVYDPATHGYVVAPGRAGAPADGVRFVLYAVNPITHEPVTTAEIGYADLIDRGPSTTSGISLRLLVVSGGTTYLDYAFAADGSDGSGTLSVEGFATDGTTRLNFEIGVQGRATATGGTLDVTFEFAVPARGFSASGHVQGASAAFGAEASAKVDLTVHTGDATIVYAVTSDSRTVDARVLVNGRVFATITGDPQHPEVRGAGGRALTAEEGEALRQLLGLADGVFKLLAQLTSPVAALVGSRSE